MTVLLARLRTWTAAALLGAVLLPFAAPAACLLAEQIDPVTTMDCHDASEDGGMTVTAAADAAACHMLDCGTPLVAPLSAIASPTMVAPLLTHDRPMLSSLVSRVLVPPTPPPQA